MTEKLRLELDTRLDDVPLRARQGKICASQVWRALYLEDPRIFEKREEVSDAGFSVDILIDASSSRKDSQEQIAAQSYILVKSLDLCRFRHRCILIAVFADIRFCGCFSLTGR